MDSDGGGSVNGAPRDLVALVHRAIERHGHRTLFAVDGGHEWTHVTYAELGRRAERLRAALVRLGVKPGDRVGVIAKNRWEWAVVLAATVGAGAVIVPMYEVQHEDDWRHILRDAKARVCFASTDAIYEKVRAMLGDLPDLGHLVGIDRAAHDDTSYRHLLSDAADESEPPPGKRLPLATPEPTDAAAFIYTSGTTGKPKGVRLSHAAFAFEMNTMADEWDFGPSDRSVSILPWAHVGGFCELLSALDRGVAVALPSSFERLGEALRVTRPTFMVAVPRVWNAFYDAIHKGMATKPPALQWVFTTALAAEKKRRAGIRPRKRERAARRLAHRVLFPAIRAKLGGELRYAISGAAALSKDVAELFEHVGIRVFEVYGQTETCAVSTANSPRAARLGTVGRPIPGVRITIDHATNDSDDPRCGEIILHTPAAMLGYHGLAGETASVLQPDGGVRTGDIGRVDDDGYLVITGRVREVYKLENGKFVTPVPIEEGLTLSPFIAQAFVWGLNKPHNVALLVVDATAVRAWCTEKGVRAAAGLLDDARVRELFTREIDARTGAFKGYERVRAFALIDEAFTADNGMLTPTLKVKRGAVLARHRAVLERLYG